ncbi:Crp/Fnr family transcriptional regulator [Mucilaginibacter robiniae]|uniref:Crp/Fnr family transcriptional regulator n=1 Tax=Mucilaginibacter robiniae TaxID=2728022 RepID=A0A7L5E2L4_9SPHI|nr:Crp/Fnr family transcriptional regulator [Mucilaginibacter robiniae]QJD97610.1 Crp/Fnr family transcriptional regulator [Mucilaginibacter robiniae]
MLSSDDIKFYLSIFQGLSLSDLTELFNLAHTRHIPAGGIYIDEGSTAKKLGLIRQGLIRAYCIKPNGDDITLLIRWENQFVASHDNIILNQPSRFIYQALEDTVLMELDYTRMESILDHNPKLSSHRNFFLLRMLAESLERTEAFVLLTSEERYLQLIQEKPDIYNRVPNKYLATLLGITPVSLSRIRKRITHQPKH